VLQHFELLTLYILQRGAQVMLLVLSIAAENIEHHSSIEGTGQSAGEITSHSGDLGASAKHHMSTA
jgi:hypothetical protein